MSDSLDPRDDLTDRLAALGRQPVAPALQSSHLTAMASVRAERSFRSSLVGRLKVGAGVFAGFLLGASGLATVGGLGPLQPIVAERAAEVANVQLPGGPKHKAAKAAKAAKTAKAQGEGGSNKIWGVDGCPPEGDFRNRGAFLKAAKDNERDADTANDDDLMSFADARKSDCGKGTGDGTDDAAEAPKVKEPKAEDTDKSEVEGAENGKSDEAEGKKDAAPGKADKGEPGDQAEGSKAEDGDDGDDGAKPARPAKPETPAGPPAEAGPGGEAGNSGVTPPVDDPESETPAPVAGVASTSEV